MKNNCSSRVRFQLATWRYPRMSLKERMEQSSSYAGYPCKGRTCLRATVRQRLSCQAVASRSGLSATRASDLGGRYATRLRSQLRQLYELDTLFLIIRRCCNLSDLFLIVNGKFWVDIIESVRKCYWYFIIIRNDINGNVNISNFQINFKLCLIIRLRRIYMW